MKASALNASIITIILSQNIVNRNIYVMVAILKKQLNIEASLYSFLQILSVNAFEKIPLDQLLTKMPSQFEENCIPKQLAFNW